MDSFIAELIFFLNNLKLYNWSTTSYARHKASDDCFAAVQSLTDKFVEIFIGKYGRSSIINPIKKVKIPIEISTDNDAKILIKRYIDYLKKLNLSESQDSDLLNIRDELVGHLNQTLYLFTLE